MKKNNKLGLLFVSPFIIGSCIFFIFPVLFSAYISFTKWDLFNAPKWIGLKNWMNMAGEPVFWTSFRNVFFFALVFVPLQTIFAVVIAYLLNQKIKGKAFYRVLYFLPVVTPWVAGAVVWQALYNSEFGFINWVLKFIHLGPFQWIESDKWWVVMASVSFMNVWKGVGQSMVMFLAGMQNVSGEVLEAAHIDGASKLQIFPKIVIPIISPMIFLVLILSTISAFTAFDVFISIFDLSMINKGNLVVNLMIYQDAFLYSRMGFASSTAWALFAVILIITVVQKTFEKRWVHYEN